MAEKTVATRSQQSMTPSKEETRSPEQYVTPPVDIYETQEGLVVKADLPGVARDSMKKRFTVWLLATLFLANVSLADAQQPGKIFRIGFLDPSTAAGSAVLVDAFRQELRKLGWIEGKNITIEYRFAEQKNERLPELAAELVRLKVDLIVASGGAPPLAAKGATSTIPIVMTTHEVAV